MESFSKEVVSATNVCQIGETLEGQWTEGETIDGAESISKKDDSEARFQNALAMSPKLEALFITSKRHSLIREKDLRDAMLMQLRKYEVTIDQLGEWAANLLKVIATSLEHQNATYKRFGPEFLEWLGTGLIQFSSPRGPRSNNLMLECLTQNKRQAQIVVDSPEKRFKSFISSTEVTDQNTMNVLINEFALVEVSDGKEIPICFHPGESTPLPAFRCQSSKKEARKRGHCSGYQSIQDSGIERATEESSSSSLPNQHQDFFKAEEAGHNMPHSPPPSPLS